MSIEVIVKPWPEYPEDGGPPAWIVSVIEPKHVHRNLKWSQRFDRFSKSWQLMNLRRGAPAAYREAVVFMRDFCSKNEQMKGIAP
jgi:hypothetical protein